MIKISSGNAAFDLGFMHELRMQGWTKKQANVMLDFALQFSNRQEMEKYASVFSMPEDPEMNPAAYQRWEKQAMYRYAWCNSDLYKAAAAQQQPAQQQQASQQEQQQQPQQPAPAPAPQQQQQQQSAPQQQQQQSAPQQQQQSAPQQQPQGGGQPQQGGQQEPGGIMYNVGKFIGRTGGALRNMGQSAATVAGNVYNDAAAGAGVLAGKVMNGVDKGMQMAKSVGNWFADKWNKVKGAAGQAADWAGDKINKTVQAGRDAAEWVADKTGKGINYIDNKVQQGANWVDDKIEKGYNAAAAGIKYVGNKYDQGKKALKDWWDSPGLLDGISSGYQSQRANYNGPQDNGRGFSTGYNVARNPQPQQQQGMYSNQMGGMAKQSSFFVSPTFRQWNPYVV